MELMVDKHLKLDEPFRSDIFYTGCVIFMAGHFSYVKSQFFLKKIASHST